MQSVDSVVPFPSLDDMPEMVVESSSSSPAPRFKISAASIASPVESRNTTTSSKITSSDKLSALPSNRNLSNQDALATSTFTTSSSIKRGWRRSFDGSDLHKLSHNVWGTPHVAVHTARFDHHPINHPKRGTSDQMSSGKETPRQRVSTESDRASLPAMRQAAISRLARGSGPSHSSPPLRSSPFKSNHPEEDSDNYLTSRSPSQSKSRAASPLRMLHNWSSGFHRSNRSSNEEPFIPIDPFRSGRFPFCGTAHRHFHHLHDVELGGSSSSGACDCDDLVPVASVRAFFKDTQTFITDTLPRELYLNLLLRLPAMYFSRVARIFEDADVSRPDIQRMINTSCGTIRGRHVHPHPPGESEAVNPEARSGGGKKGPNTNAPLSPGAISGIGLSAHIGTAPATSLMHMPLPFPDEWTPAVVSPALIRFKHSWEAFIDSLLREWKTLNVVSALLASAILTIFQIPEAAEDPVTRTLALLSLICALMSLSYGCMYIVRFGTMRSMFHASRWAEEAQKTKTLIWWNVWVLLATPAVWMAWSMLLFLSAILSFVWRTGSVLDPEDRPPLGAKAILGPRIAITLVFFLGIVYLALIVRTLKKYGSQQNAARALIEVGSSGRVDQTAAANVAVARGKTAKHRHDEIMERRGRERERSSLPRVRRREDTDTKGRKEGRKKTSGDPDAKVSAPKGVFGLVAIDKGPGARDDTHEFELQVDSKSFEDIVIQEMQV